MTRHNRDTAPQPEPPDYSCASDSIDQQSSAGFEDLSVERFSVHTEAGGGRHYVEDMDLSHKVKPALGSDTQQAVVLHKLGVDDHDTHEAMIDFYRRPVRRRPGVRARGSHRNPAGAP